MAWFTAISSLESKIKNKGRRPCPHCQKACRICRQDQGRRPMALLTRQWLHGVSREVSQRGRGCQENFGASGTAARWLIQQWRDFNSANDHLVFRGGHGLSHQATHVEICAVSCHFQSLYIFLL